MMKYIKGFCLIILSILFLILGIYLINSVYQMYSIICFILFFISLYFTIKTLHTSSNRVCIFENELRNILKTYESILARTTSIPNLKDKDIMMINTIEELVNIQLEVRKPICYMKQNESCSFMIVDDEVVYVYLLKVEESVITPIEIEIKNLLIEKKKNDGIDSDLLETIEKTTIIKLSNNKSYKISPVRKKKMNEEIEIL